jgi:hypothetical protein
VLALVHTIGFSSGVSVTMPANAYDGMRVVSWRKTRPQPICSVGRRAGADAAAPAARRRRRTGGRPSSPKRPLAAPGRRRSRTKSFANLSTDFESLLLRSQPAMSSRPAIRRRSPLRLICSALFGLREKRGQ